MSKETVVTHVTQSQYVSRHMYCINAQMVQLTLRNTLRVNPQYVIKPEKYHPVCDHPEDGLCLAGWAEDITSEQLAEVNARLAARVGKKAEPESQPKPKPAQAQAGPKPTQRKETTEVPGQPKRGLPQGLKDYLARKRAQKESS